MAANTQSPALGAGDADVAERPELFELLELDGAGRAALHEQLRQPDRRRRLAGQQLAWRLAEACDVACDVAPRRRMGCVGRCAGRPGHDRLHTSRSARHLQRRRLRGRPRPLVAPGLRVGVTAGYTTGTQWTSGFSGHGRPPIPSWPASTATTAMDKVYADAVFGYAYSYNQMWRQIFIPGLQQRTAQGSAGANQWYGQIEGGYRFDIGTNAQTPTSRRSPACRATPARRTASPRPARSRSTSRWRGRRPTRCAR